MPVVMINVILRSLRVVRLRMFPARPLGVIHIEKKLLTFPNILICRISFLFLPSWYQRLLIVYWWNKTPNVDYINWISD